MEICLFGGSSGAVRKSFLEQTHRLGVLMAQRGHGMTFGGGGQGVMGAAAQGVREGGGRVTGVAPRFFQVDGVLFQDCQEMIYTDTMGQRKAIMEDRAEAFVVAPGGIGTYEEFFEVLTLKQLGRHNKAIVVFDVDGYYESMERFVENTVAEGFMTQACRGLYQVCREPEAVLAYLETYDPEALDVRHLKNI